IARLHLAAGIRHAGNADRDLVAGMNPHPEGASEMVRIILPHGPDPEARALAEAVIREPEREIAWMQAIRARLPAG
nr:DUF305 domain-containing protein [Rubritepida sp.]